MEVQIQRSAVVQVLPKGTAEVSSLQVGLSAPVGAALARQARRLPAALAVRGRKRDHEPISGLEVCRSWRSCCWWCLYTLPNFFGEAPAGAGVIGQEPPSRSTLPCLKRVEAASGGRSVTPDTLRLEGTSVRARFDTPDEQLKAKDAIEKALITDATDPCYIVALNLVPRTPAWLTALAPNPCTWGWTCAAACTSCCRWTWTLR